MHYSLTNLIDPLADFPHNLEKGFYEVLRFDHMSQDAARIQNASSQGLSQCGLLQNASIACPNNYSDPSPITRTENITRPIDNITGAFENSMQLINKVANDKYLGVEKLKDTQVATNRILEQLEQLKNNSTNGTMECVASNPIFCSIHTSSQTLLDGVADVKKTINDFVDNEFAKQVKSYSDYTKLLIALPYVFVLSMLFFTCWFVTDGKCICGGVSFFGCCALIPYLLLWFLFFVVCSIVVGIGAAFQFVLQDEKVPGVMGEPTLRELLQHIETKFPEFWDVVFKDLGEPLLHFWYASCIYWVVCLLVFLFGCCMYSCGPYRKSAPPAKSSS